MTTGASPAPDRVETQASGPGRAGPPPPIPDRIAPPAPDPAQAEPPTADPRRRGPQDPDSGPTAVPPPGRAGTPPTDRRGTVAGAIALLSLAAVLLEATVDLLGDDPLFWVLTPLRLVIGTGIVAALVARVRPTALRTPLDVPIAVLLIAQAAATVLAGQDFAAWRGLFTAVAAFYLVVAVRRVQPDSWTALGLLGLLAVAIAATTAVRQNVNGTATGFCRGTLDGSADVCGPDAFIRAVGTFSNPNLLAAFLLLMVPIAAGGALALADRSSRLLGAALVVVGGLAMLMTVSRGGYIAAVAGVVAFLVLRGPTRRALLYSAAGTGATAALFVVAIVLGASVGVREDVWGAAVRLLVANPLGVGPGRVGPLLDSGIAGEEAFQHAHNVWLNFALEAGVLGLLAVLAVTALTTVAVIGGARAGSPVSVAAGAGLAGYAVMSLADHPANALRISLLLWAVLALVAADAPRSLVTRPWLFGHSGSSAASDPVEADDRADAAGWVSAADPSELPTTVQPVVPRSDQPATEARSRSGSR